MNSILFSYILAAQPADVVTYQVRVFQFFENLASGCTTTGQRWIAFGLCTMLSLLIACACEFIIRKILMRLARKTKNTYDDRLIDALHNPVVAGLTITGMYFSTAILSSASHISIYVHRIYLAIIILLILRFILQAIRIVSDAFHEIAAKAGNTYNSLLINLITPVCKTIIWVISILFILDNVFQFNIASLLAGAGIAAMAIAFAAQNTIANIFGAIALIVDRPFQIGQRIQVDGKDGIVETIGLRSTRIRALDGTLWCVPNRTMTDSPILNFSTRPNFKYCFEINLTYSHTTDQLRKGKELLHTLLDHHPLFDMEKQPPRITFAEMGKYSLALQALCWFQTTDFMEFTRAREELNFKILDALNQNGFELAFPSQSIYIEKCGSEKKTQAKTTNVPPNIPDEKENG